jgi:polysaccharide pyruvyl transferase WcaK-like protein
MIWHHGSKLFNLDKIMLGEHDSSNVKIAFCPSAGNVPKPHPKWFGAHLNKFAHISVRDFTTKELVENHSSHADVPVFIDPCFHLNGSKYDNWSNDTKKIEEVVVYSPYCWKLQELLPADFINKNNFKLLGYYPRSSFYLHQRSMLMDPLQVLTDIKRSKFLVTTTFHGVMMALMTKTPFVAFGNPSLNARLNSPIQECFDIKKRVVTDVEHKLTMNQISDMQSSDDFNFQRLSELANESKSWLEGIIGQ